MKRAWRKIVTREVIRHPSASRGGYSVLYSLDCGHSHHRKGSQEPRGDRVICRECELTLNRWLYKRGGEF